METATATRRREVEATAEQLKGCDKGGEDGARTMGGEQPAWARAPPNLDEELRGAQEKCIRKSIG